MARTAGVKLGSLVIPLFVLAILTGVLAGAGAGAVFGLFLAIPIAANLEVPGVGNPGSWAMIPILSGIPVGGFAGLVPAVGALAGLYVHAGKVPFLRPGTNRWQPAWVPVPRRPWLPVPPCF